MSFVSNSMPIIVTVVTFVVYAAIGNNITAATAFTSLSLFQIIRSPILAVPMIISRIIDLNVVNKRISSFLNAPSRDKTQLYTGVRAIGIDGHFFSREPACMGMTVFKIINGTFSWPTEEVIEEKDDTKDDGMYNKPVPIAQNMTQMQPPTLSGINLSIECGSFTVIIGPVGCGKSSLLACALCDIPRTKGHVFVRGDIIYCAQDPWIQVTIIHSYTTHKIHIRKRTYTTRPTEQNMTLRDNILFGHKLDEHLYLEVIDACALTPDIAKVYIYGSYSYKYQVLLYEYFTNITIKHIAIYRLNLLYKSNDQLLHSASGG